MKRMQGLAIGLLGVASLALVTMFAGQTQATTTAVGDPAAIFKAKCAVCHAANGSGDTPMGKKLGVRDLRSPEVQKQSNGQLIADISKGKGKMPAFGSSLSSDQINQLVAYIRALKK